MKVVISFKLFVLETADYAADIYVGSIQETTKLSLDGVAIARVCTGLRVQYSDNTVANNTKLQSTCKTFNNNSI